MGICRGCGAEIRWVTTALGKRIPLDPEPAKRVVLRDRSSGYPEQVADGSALVVDTYMPHHATCPEAHRFRRRESAV